MVFGRGERIGIAAARRDELANATLAEVMRLHNEDPKSLGLETASLAQRLRVRLPEWVLGQIVRELAQSGKVEIAGTRVRRA